MWVVIFSLSRRVFAAIILASEWIHPAICRCWFSRIVSSYTPADLIGDRNIKDLNYAELLPTTRRVLGRNWRESDRISFKNSAGTSPQHIFKTYDRPLRTKRRFPRPSRERASSHRTQKFVLVARHIHKPHRIKPVVSVQIP